LADKWWKQFSFVNCTGIEKEMANQRFRLVNILCFTILAAHNIQSEVEKEFFPKLPELPKSVEQVSFF